MSLSRRFARLVALLLVVLAGMALAQAQPLTATESGRERVFDALVDVFKDNYWSPDHLDWDQWANSYREAALSAESRAAFDQVVRRMVSAVGDDHSSWMGLVDLVDEPHELPREPAQTGIGIRHTLLQGVGVVIERVFPDTPAAEAGLRRGDVIVRLNGEDVRDLHSSQEVASLFGRAVAENEVKLRVKRKHSHLNIAVTPKPIRFTEVANRPAGEMLDDNTGYIFLPTFNAPFVAEEMHRVLEDLLAKGAEAVILDLRGNLGGRLGELGLVLGAFIEGPWAQAVSRGELAWRGMYQREPDRGINLLLGRDDDYRSRIAIDDPTFFDGPLVVLVDRASSSAGEIAAHVLQDLGRAKVIGEPTRGNVEAVRGFDLPDGSVVMVAVANVQSIEGRTFDDGVTPDFSARTELEELARGFDAPLAEALRAVKELPFTPGRYF